MLALLLTTLAVPSSGQLIQQIWPSTAFAPQSASTTSQVPSLSFSNTPAGVFPALCSVRFSGTIVSPTTQLYNFSVGVGDGGVRLWVDDFLVVDAGGNHTPSLTRVKSFLNIPLKAGVPKPIRLEYTRWGGGSGDGGGATLELWWNGNSTADTLVPPSAFAPTLSKFLVNRNALRDRLECPVIPWQTYSMESMAAHVLMPAGLALSSTLAVLGGGTQGQQQRNATLGRIIPFRNGNPALVQPGLRSLNGSDYTLLTVSKWDPAGNASVTLESTVVNGALVFLATCLGGGGDATSACATLHLVIEPFMMAERAGVIEAGADGQTLQATLPGFPPVTLTPLSGVPSPVPWDCSGAPSGSNTCLALPLAAGATGYWAGSAGGGGAASPPPPTVGAARAAIASAAAALTAHSPYASNPTLAPLWEGLSSALAWNSVYTPYEGVITPVSHVMGDIWGIGFILFEWDSYFLALMASSLQPGVSRDLGYATLIQVTLGRTLMGFVPNGGAGPRRTYDRSEDQVGALVLKAIVERTGDSWLLEGLLPVMLTWNDWVWRRRRGEGVLGAGAPDGFADLMCLGSDPSLPRSDTQGTLQAARYEGMDNSAIFDAPPAAYNQTTHHMNVYEVAATALFASDTEATIALCAAAIAGGVEGAGVFCGPNATDPSFPPLEQRLARVQAAMAAHMWDQESGLYANVLFNGTKLGVYAPTSFFPMISGAASDAQALQMASALASPLGFCYNLSHTPAAAAEMLVQWGGRGEGGDVGHACVTPACTGDAINALHMAFKRVEAVVLLPEGGGGGGGGGGNLTPLTLFTDPTTGATALVDGTTPPDSFFSQVVRQEGWVWEAPPTNPGGGVGWPTVNLSLWHSPPAGGGRGAYATCGTDACTAEAASKGFSLVRPMGYAFNGSGPANTPCKVGGPSVARADPSFNDQDYWRGRAWGPHHMLMYWALARYSHLPAANAVRSDLVAMGARLQLENWELGVVCENVNGVIGTCEDSGNADPFYTWGALFGFPALLEATTGGGGV